MSKLVQRVKFGGHGQGSLAKYDDGPNWISIYCVRGKEHRQSTGTPDLKLARRVHKQRLDELAADRQGLRKFIAPMVQRVTVGELLDDYTEDIKLRGLKSATTLLYHMKPVRDFFGAHRATDVTADVVDRYIAARLRRTRSRRSCGRCTTGVFTTCGDRRSGTLCGPVFAKAS